MRIPEILIIGAAKCGTTTLADVLRKHPRIYVPPIKEVAFFGNDNAYQKGLDYYCSYFAHADRSNLLCDASPQYMFRDVAPMRIQASYGKITPPLFVVILRNPVDRAYSAYWQAVSSGFEKQPFRQAVETELQSRRNAEAHPDGRTMGAYISAGLYGKQIKRWLGFFPLEQFLILTTEQLSQANRDTYNKITAFLSISPLSDQDIETTSNRAKLPRFQLINNLVRGKWQGRQFLAHIISRNMRHNLKQAVDRLNMKSIRYTPMNHEDKEWCTNLFTDDIKELEDVLQRQFHWSCW